MKLATDFTDNHKPCPTPCDGYLLYDDLSVNSMCKAVAKKGA